MCICMKEGIYLCIYVYIFVMWSIYNIVLNKFDKSIHWTFVGYFEGAFCEDSLKVGVVVEPGTISCRNAM